MRSLYFHSLACPVYPGRQDSSCEEERKIMENYNNQRKIEINKNGTDIKCVIEINEYDVVFYIDDDIFIIAKEDLIDE